MQTAVANHDFPVALVSDDGKSFKKYQVLKKDVLTLLSDRMKGVTISGSSSSSGVMIMGGYLVGIEGQLVFVNEGLLEVSQQG